MKKVALLFIGIFIASICFLQTKRDSLTDAIANEMCSRMDSLPFQDIYRDMFTIQFIEVMVSTFDKHSLEIKEIFSIEDLREDSALLLKQKVKNIMLKSCFKLQSLIKKNQSDYLKNYKRWHDEPTYITLISVKLKKIINTDISFIEFETYDGKTEKAYWLNTFKGSNQLADNPNKFINKWVALEYEQIRKYNYITKKYEKIKIISSISLN